MAIDIKVNIVFSSLKKKQSKSPNYLIVYATLLKKHLCIRELLSSLLTFQANKGYHESTAAELF